MDLDALQKRIHRIYEGNVDYYSSSEDDYILRTGLCNDAIEEWKMGGE